MTYQAKKSVKICAMTAMLKDMRSHNTIIRASYVHNLSDRKVSQRIWIMSRPVIIDADQGFSLVDFNHREF